ncbi:MAG: glycosyltransferase family 9 protein [Bacteroidaceae bacterium]|nr:glycosyltransferase family 9 protein [Bacteroidaceae bacterium]
MDANDRAGSDASISSTECEDSRPESRVHLLLIRFSALGDILMSVPVIDALARRYPDIRVTVVSRPFVGSVMQLLPSNVDFFGIDPRSVGLARLYRELAALRPTHVCDLHDVLRTKYLRLRFRLAGLPVTYIHKGRKARRAFLHAQVKTQQPTPFARYAEALGRLGFPVEIDPSQRFSLVDDPRPHTSDGPSRIGVAPFAAHPGKVYPLERMKQVVQQLSARGIQVFLFGAGEKERCIMEQWAEQFEGVQSMVGRMENMAAELHFMSRLDLMLTMDSGNMHLASLAGVRVISIWGATHPLAGFLGWGQRMDDVIQLPLPCRPCSTYGSRPCRFGDWRCLAGIEVRKVVDFIIAQECVQ